MFLWPSGKDTPSQIQCSFRVERPARVQVVVIQNGIENEEIAALGLATPDRIVRKQHDVALVDRYIDDRRMLSDLVTRFHEAGHEKLLRIGIPQHHARPGSWWNDVDAVAQLLVGDRRGLPRLDVGLGWNLGTGASLRYVRIVRRPTTCRPTGTVFFRGRSASPPTADAVAD